MCIPDQEEMLFGEADVMMYLSEALELPHDCDEPLGMGGRNCAALVQDRGQLARRDVADVELEEA